VFNRTQPHSDRHDLVCQMERLNQRLRAAEAVCEAADELIRRQAVTFARATDGARKRLREGVARWKELAGK
jgi:hypothetical protein